MITDKDIQGLIGLKNSYFMLTKYIFIIAILISIISSSYNLHLAFHYAELDGLNITNTVNLWSEEASLRKTYTGYQHLSILKLNNSIFSLGATIIITIQLFSIITTRNKNKRILYTLIKCGEISKTKELSTGHTF